MLMVRNMNGMSVCPKMIGEQSPTLGAHLSPAASAGIGNGKIDVTWLKHFHNIISPLYSFDRHIA